LSLNGIRDGIRFSLIAWLGFMAASCSTSLPKERHDVFHFPESMVFSEEPSGEFKNRPYEVLGWVRSRAHYPTFEQDPNSNKLCRNYYNKAAKDLLIEAKKAKAEAVIKVRSVVLLLDGKTEEYVTPECSDDGAEGEILLRGVAIKWKPIDQSEQSSKH
jgi:hypothetical protein